MYYSEGNMQRPPRSRTNRMDGDVVARTYRIKTALDIALAEVAREEFRNNKTMALEQALIEFLNRRRDVRAA